MTRVLAVASEVFPLVKTGGLADVVGALPQALSGAGVQTTTLVPGYPAVLAASSDATRVHHFPDLFGAPADVLLGTASGLDLLAIDAPHLYARPGNPYLGPDGQDWPDNDIRFAALGAAAAALAIGTIAGPASGAQSTAYFDIVHVHDWQAALTTAYLHFHPGPRPGTVLTIHNLAFQGMFPASLFPRLGLPDAAFRVDGLEFYNLVGFLKAGLVYADRLTTVSPTYAREITLPEHGAALDGVLRQRAGSLSGILNGIDDTVWDPAADTLIAGQFSAATLDRRDANKTALRQRLGLADDPDTMLIGVISRLTTQKGLDLLLARLDTLASPRAASPGAPPPVPDPPPNPPAPRSRRSAASARESSGRARAPLPNGPTLSRTARGLQFAILGAGDPALEHGFVAAALRYPGRVACTIGYDEPLAHLIQAGCDALLVPSRFEPCGLTQLCALRYGCIPIVARVGGLSDTVIDSNEAASASGVATGLQFTPVTADALADAVERAVQLWQDPAGWRRMQCNAMAADVSWRRSAARYAALFRALQAERR